MPDINRAAFDILGPNEDELRICLDFGTAMSKAWASRYSDDSTIPLVLGRAAGEGNELAVPSSIFISQSGKIFFGRQAEIQHRKEIGNRRRRFDNLKSVLCESKVDRELDEIGVSREIDPTGSLTIGGLLTLYIAWLTDLSLVELERQIHAANEPNSSGQNPNNLRYVRRRFAIPCFENSYDESVGGDRRARWARKIMRKALLRAQIIADTLNGHWDDLTVYDALRLFETVRGMEISRCDRLLARDASVREPVAAGASRFEEMITEGKARRMLLVIDAGAGTTDFAIFQVFSDQETRYALISSGVSMCLIAGNRVDQVLMEVILDECGVDLAQNNKEDRESFKWELESNLRNIKQILFQEKRARIDFLSDVTGELHIDTLLEDHRYMKLGEELCTIRDRLIDDLFRKNPKELDDLKKHMQMLSKPFPIHVLLTGGSGEQPIIKDLAKGHIVVDGLNIEFKEVRALPNWINDLQRDQAELVARAYPQCAVSIGGSAREVPQERNDLVSMVNPAAPGERRLEGNYMKGV